jgi:hypothetical protein
MKPDFKNDPAYIAKNDTYKHIGVPRRLSHFLYNTPAYSFPPIHKNYRSSPHYFAVADVNDWLKQTDVAQVTQQLQAQYDAHEAEQNKGMALVTMASFISAPGRAPRPPSGGKTKTVHLYEHQGEETRGLTLDPFTQKSTSHAIYINPTDYWS